MATINRDVLLHLMKLSKLEIPAEQEQFYLDSLNKLMDTLALLQNVVTDDPSEEAYPKSNLILREDIAQPSFDRAACEKQAPQVLSHFYIVPQVIE